MYGCTSPLLPMVSITMCRGWIRFLSVGSTGRGPSRLTTFGSSMNLLSGIAACAFSRAALGSWLAPRMSKLDARCGDADLPPPSVVDPADENDEATGDRMGGDTGVVGVEGRTGVEMPDSAAGVPVPRLATAALILSIA